MADRKRVEFGDFQTPPGLAADVCRLLTAQGVRPAAVVEPTCGTGAFLAAAGDTFYAASSVTGFEINPQYADEARQTLGVKDGAGGRCRVFQADSFTVDWSKVLSELPDPLLITGNPPWVTNSTLGAISSSNVPRKSNVDALRGIEALTGKSNFDISEAILRECLAELSGRNGCLAVLCKTAVARKLLEFAWNESMPLASCSIYRIDAKRHFDASVDACLLVVSMSPAGAARECDVFPTLDATTPEGRIGMRSGRLVPNTGLFDKWAHLTEAPTGGWRSGIKHDCSRVFELRRQEGQLWNGAGESVDVEDDVLFPLLKSSDLSAGREPHRTLLVPQQSMSDSPGKLRKRCPRAWDYLVQRDELLEARRSSIYRNRPPYSIFGIGPYSFTDWKVAVSGLYKDIEFRCLGPHDGKPVVFDDTCYFYSCVSRGEAECLGRILASEPAREFLAGSVFLDAKRPVTAALLNSLNLKQLALAAGCSQDDAARFFNGELPGTRDSQRQRLLFEEPVATAVD